MNTDLLKNFKVVVIEKGKAFSFRVEATYINGKTCCFTRPVTFLHRWEAISVGVGTAYRECAIARLFDLIQEWNNSGLVSAKEFESAEDALFEISADYIQ